MNFDHVLSGAFEFAFHAAPSAFCCTKRGGLLHADFAKPLHKQSRIVHWNTTGIRRQNAITHGIFTNAGKRRQTSRFSLHCRRIVLGTRICHHIPHHLDWHFAVAAVTAATAFEAVIYVLHGQILREKADTEIVVRIIRIDEMRLATAETKHKRSAVIHIVHRSAVGIHNTRSALLFHFKNLDPVQRSRNRIDAVHPKLHTRKLRNESPGIDKHMRFFARNSVHEFHRAVVCLREHPVVEHDHQDRKQKRYKQHWTHQ